MGLNEEKNWRERGRAAILNNQPQKWRSLGKDGFAQRNGDVSRGHVDETKIRQGEELGDRHSCEEQRRPQSPGELRGI